MGLHCSLRISKAWRGGPVAPELYALHRGKFLIRPGELGNAGTSEGLTEEERTLIAAVCDAMSEATGADLSQRTHAESPWLDARKGLAPSEPSAAVITKQAMRNYYQTNSVLR